MYHCHSRFLFVVGQLVRHGAGILQGSAPADSPIGDIKQLLAVLISFYKLPKSTLNGNNSLKVKEKALEGLGLLFVAHPAALLEPAANAAMQQALQPCAPIPLKLKVLGNLLELLKVHLPCVGSIPTCPNKLFCSTLLLCTYLSPQVCSCLQCYIAGNIAALTCAHAFQPSARWLDCEGMLLATARYSESEGTVMQVSEYLEVACNILSPCVLSVCGGCAQTRHGVIIWL